MDKIEAIRFLKYLTHKNINGQFVPDQQHLFQLYPEKGQGLAAQNDQWTSLVSSLGNFKKAQDDGYAIGVTVNSLGDWQKRKNENVQYYRAVWHDDDGEGFNGDNLPEATLVVETSPNRFHRYWFIDRSKGEMTKDEWTSVMEVMAQVYGSDKGHPCQALRLPGSYHQKQGRDKRHPVRIVQESGNLYSVSELLEAFGTMAEYIDSFEQPGADKIEIPVDWGQDRERIAKALKTLSAENRDKWFSYGGAIYDACGGAIEGFRIWDDWSQTSEKYDHKAQVAYWNKEFPKRENAVNRAGMGTIIQDARETGANLDEILLPEEMWQEPDYEYLDFSGAKLDDDEFPKTVINEVRQKFDKWGHMPTEGHYDGLMDIAKIYHRMAAGCLPPNFFLSALPCGMGKTTVVTECTRQLLGWPKYKDAAVIYFLFRLEEINALVEKMGLSDDEFSVLVSDKKSGDVTRKGSADRENARVLFTTQQQLDARLKKDGTFNGIADFYYKGRPRSVRVWDEAIIPSTVLTLEKDDIFSMLRDLRRGGYTSLADTLEEWSIALKGKETGEIVEVPDASGIFASPESLRELFSDAVNRDKAEALWHLSGRSVRVRRDNLSGAATLDYVDNLPEDLAPMLILDASGGLRKTYAFWEKYRKGLGEALYLLQSPKKTYSGLTIHHWNKGAGKSANKNWTKAREIAEGVAKTVNTEIPKCEEVLVIHHKQAVKNGPDMVELIRKQIYPNAKVHFLNWGKHTATNEFAHVKHVILAGILQYNEAQYEAVGRASKKAKTEEEFADDDFQRVRFGEIAHNIFQAACRGQVRKSDNGDCPHGCHLWIIFSDNKKGGFSRRGLGWVFPRAPIVDWEPLGKQLTGKAKETFEFVQSVFVGPTAELKASDVMEHAGMQKANFYKLIDREDLKAALEAEGIELVRPRGLPGYFRKVSSNVLPWELPDTKNAVGF